MDNGLDRLYPQPATRVAHRGRYLDDPLVPTAHHGPFIYSNFVVSLDGRIALSEGDDAHRAVPRAIANSRDWRLFQELAGRAELLVTSGRYLRDLSAGTAQDVLPVSTASTFEDIHEWRRHAGMTSQPAVLVLSASLDFQPPTRLIEQGREVIVVTTTQASEQRARDHEAAGADVIALPPTNGGVDGAAVRQVAQQRNFKTVYSVTGPDVLATLASANSLDALFLTTVHRLLAGCDFSTITRGQILDPALDLELTSLYLDTQTPEGMTQTFGRYDRRTAWAGN